MTETLTP